MSSIHQAGTTGLRPDRPSGFVVRAERMGEKVVIHNYGHGGGGITLSWGSSALAVREAPAVADRRAAVVGAGIMGAFAMFYSFVQDISPGHTSKSLGLIGATVWFISSRDL